MSLALVRQALAFVDPEETQVRGKKRRAVDTSRPQSISQASSHPKKQKSKRQTKSAVLSKEEQVEENIKKILALSTPTANKAVTEKIVQRAIKGKPLLEAKIEVKDTEEKSILFPEENFTTKKTKRHNKKSCNLQIHSQPTVDFAGLRCLGTLLYRGAHVVYSVPYLSVPIKHCKVLNIPITLKLRVQNIPFNFKFRHGTMSPANRDDWIIIGVSGVTCGGKTTLANKLQHLLSPVYIFHQDKYFYPDDSPHHVRCKNLDHNNYDILSALNMQLMYDDVVRTINGHNKAHIQNLERSCGKLEAKGKKFLVVEGFTVLNYKPIMELCHLRYYFVLEYAECLNRRVYRLYDPPDIDGYFDQCVWPEHLKYRAEIEKDKRVTIFDGTRHDSLDIVISDLKAMGAEKI